MPKDKKKEILSEDAEDKKEKSKKEKVDVKRKLNMEEFFGECPLTSKENSANAIGFKVWWEVIEKKELWVRMYYSDWEKEIDKYLNREIK